MLYCKCACVWGKEGVCGGGICTVSICSVCVGEVLCLLGHVLCPNSIYQFIMAG